MIVAVLAATVTVAAALLLYRRTASRVDRLAELHATLLRPALNYTSTTSEPGPAHLTPDPADPRMLSVTLVSSGGSPARILATRYTVQFHGAEPWHGDGGPELVGYLASHGLELDRDYHLLSFTTTSLVAGWRDLVFVTTLPTAHRFAQLSCAYTFAGLTGEEVKEVHFVPLPGTGRLPLPAVRGAKPAR